MEEFSTIVTSAGNAKITALLAGGTLTLAQFAVGDSNGAYYDPDEGQTSLENELWRGPIASLATDPKDSTRRIVTAFIPPNVGGWWVREAGLYTDDTPPVLFAVAKIPAREKVDPLSGSAVGMYIKLYLDVNSARIEVVPGVAEIPPVLLYDPERDTYPVNESVSFLGSIYVCIIPTTEAGQDPLSAPTHWQLISAKGDTGDVTPEAVAAAAAAEAAATQAGVYLAEIEAHETAAAASATAAEASEAQALQSQQYAEFSAEAAADSAGEAALSATAAANSAAAAASYTAEANLGGNAATLQGWQASQTPGPNQIVVTKPDGTVSDSILRGLKNATLKPEFFGVHYNYVCGDTQSAQIIPTPFFDLGFGSFRIWDADGCMWAEVHTAPGVFNWTKLDTNMQFAEDNGMEVIYTLGQAPAWATGGVRVGPSYNLNNSTPPSNNQYWVDYITALVTRYQGRIKAYEIWNEPNYEGSWTGTPAQLVTLTQLAYQTIKAIDPDAIVLTAACDQYRGLSFFDSYMAAGAGEHVDGIAVHLYPDTNHAPEQMIDMVQKYRATAFKYGCGHMPIWCTEVGGYKVINAETGLPIGLITSPNHPGVEDLMPDKQSAAYAMRMFLAAWVSGLERCCLYALDNMYPSLRLLNIDEFSYLTPTVMQQLPTINAAGYSFKRFVSWALGQRLDGFAKSGTGTYMIATSDANGRHWVVWTDDTTPTTVEFPEEAGIGEVQRWNDAKEYPLTPSVQVDYAPVILHGKNDFLGQTVIFPVASAGQSEAVQVQMDGLGFSTDPTQGVGFEMKNTTLGTALVPQQEAPKLAFKGNQWMPATSTSDPFCFTFTANGNGGANAELSLYTLFLGQVRLAWRIDAYGQLGTPMMFAKFDSRNVLNKGQVLSNDADATAAYNQYSPFHLFKGSGWTTAAGGASKATSYGQLLAPETGVNNAQGVFKGIFGNFGSGFTGYPFTPTEGNELYRYEWGERLGVLFNKQQLPGYQFGVDGLPIYANNAAAVAGGLRVGSFYRTGGDPDMVCVVH